MHEPAVPWRTDRAPHAGDEVGKSGKGQWFTETVGVSVKMLQVGQIDEGRVKADGGGSQQQGNQCRGDR